MHAREGEEEKGDRREGGYPAEVRWLLSWRRSCMVARDGGAARWEQKWRERERKNDVKTREGMVYCQV